MADVSYKRSQALQIYLKEGVAEEKVLLEVWEALKGFGGRKQNLFRDMLLTGFQALLEADQIPEDVMISCDLDRLLERKIRRKNRAAANRQEVPVAPPMPGYQYPYHPAPVYPAPQPVHMPVYPGYAHQPMPVEAPPSQVAPQVLPVAPTAAPAPAPVAAPQAAAPRRDNSKQSARANQPEADQTTNGAETKKPQFNLM